MLIQYQKFLPCLKMVNGAEDMVKRKGFTVLIVDDDPVIQKIHEMYAKRFGLMTQVVENGKKAVDLHNFGASFNLVLIDREMPIMNGLEATKELRAMGVESLIVGVTSHGLPEEKKAFMEAGLNYCFEKPLTFDHITFLIKQLSNQTLKNP